MSKADGQLVAAETQGVESVALQIDAQAQALRNHASADYRVAKALQEVAGAVRSGQVPTGFVGVSQDRIRAEVASYAAAIGGAR